MACNSESLSGHSDNAATEEHTTKPYENSGAEHGVSEINSGYTCITDIDLELRKKDEEDHDYDNNTMEQTGEEQYAKIEEKKKTTCRRQICVIVIVSIVVIAGIGIGVWRSLVQFDNSPPSPDPPKQDYYVRRGDNVSMHYTINLVNPREIRLLKETAYGNDTLFSVDNLTNDTLQTVGNDQMNFTISVKDAEIEVSVSISSTQCLSEGTYYVLAISDTNGFKYNGSNLLVLSECPCRFEFNISSLQDIKCSFPDAGNTSIVIIKASGDNPRILVNYSDIIRPSDIPNTNGFTASWLSNGTLVVEIRLGQIDCTHEGYYNINLTMNDITRMYDVYVHVIDYPEEPRLSVLEGGITEDKMGGQMLCSAITGCTKTPFILEYQPNEDQWIRWLSNYTTEFEPNSVFQRNDPRWYSKSVINITKYEIKTIDKRKFRCSYKSNGKTLTSDTLCVRVIPANFCKNNSGCNHEHPFFCNKFITCTTVAEERSCPPGLHFLYKGDCGGNCKQLVDQYQRDCNGYCDWPQNVNCTDRCL